MKYTYKNINIHTIQISGPNKEPIKFMPGQIIELSEYYLKYVPKYVKVIDFIPQKSIISTKIGVGILSCNRLNCIQRLLNSIKKFSKEENIEIFVSDESTDNSVKEYLRNINWIKLIDNKQRMGVVHNTNKLLKVLESYKYKLILNDDVEIKSFGWEKFYFEIMKEIDFHHFCYRQLDLYGASKHNETHKKYNNTTIKTILSKPQGAVLAFDDVAFGTVGYYDTSFPKYGMAHVDWSNRISNSKIQPPGFHDVYGSENFFKIYNEDSVEKQKSKMLREARVKYEKLKNIKNRIYVSLNLKDENPMSTATNCEIPKNQISTTNNKIIVWINTYNRQNTIRKLLKDIVINKKSHDITIIIVDDHSSNSYSSLLNDYKNKIDIDYLRVNKNHGKMYYWKLCNIAINKIMKYDFKYCIKIDDDMRLVKDFFDKCINLWNDIEDTQKIGLNILLDNDTPKKRWTGFDPVIHKNKFITHKSQWIDCNFFVPRLFFALLEQIPMIPLKRWNHNESKSSGVGEKISKKMVYNNKSLYIVNESLIYHGNIDSAMNKEERIFNPLITKNFNVNSNYGLISSKIIYTMATYTKNGQCLREISLQKTIQSVINQCDELWIYLNDFVDIPSYLNHSKIKIIRSQDYIECGDIGKFHDCDAIIDSYHFTIDDDIIYPSDYTNKMIEKIEQYNRKAIIGVHAAIINPPLINYYRQKTAYHFQSALQHDTFVNVLGTGTAAFHSSTIRIKKEDFKIKNMADIWFAIKAQKQKVPMIAIGRDNMWLKPCELDYTESIHSNSKNQNHGKVQTDTINQFHASHGFSIIRLDK